MGELIYAAISEETVVKAFMEANPASDLVQVIVIDKDFTEHYPVEYPQEADLPCVS